MAGLDELIDAAVAGGKPGPNAGDGASAMSHQRIGREGAHLLSDAFSPRLTTRRERALARQNGGNSDAT